jgi:hypothetical protein
VLKAKVHVANVVNQEGIKPLLDGAKELFPRLYCGLRLLTASPIILQPECDTAVRSGQDWPAKIVENAIYKPN